MVCSGTTIAKTELEALVLSRCKMVSDCRPSWVNSVVSHCCFSHMPLLHCFWLLLLLYLLHWLLLPSFCSKSVLSEFLTMSCILILYKRLSDMLFSYYILLESYAHISKYCINVYCHFAIPLQHLIQCL